MRVINWPGLALAVGLAGVTATGQTADEIVIAERGKAPAFCVVLPKDATGSERYAAKELCDWTERLTGVRLATAESAAKGMHGLYLERPTAGQKLGDEGFELRAAEGDVHVVGGCRGILYGAYELLERFGGIAWLDSDFTDVPKTDRFAVPGDLADVQRPAFARRVHDWRGIAADHAFAARSRINHFNRPSRVGGNFPGFDGPLGWCHTFNWLISPAKHFAEHPEWFSEIKGRRTKDHSQLCLSNPEVLRIVTEKALERVRLNLERKTGVRYYGISQNDWNGYCECPACSALDAAEGSHAASVFAFVNKVAEEVEKVDPNAVVSTLAYMYSRHPPRTIRPRHNVMPMLCSIECDFSKPMDVSRFSENVSFREDLERWRQVSKHLMIWDYTANWRATPCPQHNIRTLQGNARYYRDCGVTELFYEGWSNRSPSPELGALKAWISAKMLWNPDRPLRPLLERFCRGYYGAAAPHVLAYLDLLERQVVDEEKTPFIYRTTIDQMPWTDAFLDEACALWRQAADAVKGASPQVVSNVFWGAFGADYTKLAKYISASGKWRPVILSRVVAAKVDLGEFREMCALARSAVAALDANPDAVLSSRLNDIRHKGLLRALATAEEPSTEIDRVLFQEWAFSYSDHPKSTTIFRVGDKSATDGRAIHMKGAGSGWKVTCGFKSAVALDAGATYRMRVRMKAQPVPGADPKKGLVGFGLFDRTTKKTVSSGALLPAAASGDYTWIPMNAWTANAAGDYIFYVDPRAADCSFDCLEIVRADERKEK